MENKTKDEGIVNYRGISRGTKPLPGGAKEIECGCCQGGSCGWNPKPRPDKENETEG